MGEIAADSRVFFVHRAFGRDERDNAARSYLVQGFPKEIIVDQPMVLVIPPVHHLEISKGDVADGHIKKAVRHLHRFKSLDGNAGILIELLGNPAADAVNLHAIGFAACHISRKQTDKITGATGRFQKVALLESHL